jgi:AcrR family transcriptional regulator
MTRAKITAAAAKLWQQVGPDKFTVRALARKLNIVPTTVYAHFHGREPELRKEIARATLEALTPHYQPKQHPKDYLRAFLLRLLESFRQSPDLGRLVIVQLTDDLMLSLGFVERMSMTIRALGGGQDLIRRGGALGKSALGLGPHRDRQMDANKTRCTANAHRGPAYQHATSGSPDAEIGIE